MKTRLLTAALCAALAATFAGCHSGFNPETAPVSSLTVPAGPGVAKVRAAIMDAVYARDWQIVKDEPGVIELTYKHQFARVDYDAKNVKVRQTGGDRDVSGWILKLGTEINRRLAHTAP